MVQVISRGEFDIWILSFVIAAVSFDIKESILLSRGPLNLLLFNWGVFTISPALSRVEGCFRD